MFLANSTHNGALLVAVPAFANGSVNPIGWRLRTPQLPKDHTSSVVFTKVLSMEQCCPTPVHNTATVDPLTSSNLVYDADYDATLTHNAHAWSVNTSSFTALFDPSRDVTRTWVACTPNPLPVLGATPCSGYAAAADVCPACPPAPAVCPPCTKACTLFADLPVPEPGATLFLKSSDLAAPAGVLAPLDGMCVGVLEQATTSCGSQADAVLSLTEYPVCNVPRLIDSGYFGLLSIPFNAPTFDVTLPTFDEDVTSYTLTITLTQDGTTHAFVASTGALPAGPAVTISITMPALVWTNTAPLTLAGTFAINTPCATTPPTLLAIAHGTAAWPVRPPGAGPDARGR